MTRTTFLQRTGQPGQPAEEAAVPQEEQAQDLVAQQETSQAVMAESPEASPEEQLAAWLLAKWFSQPENQAHMIQASGYLPVRRSVQEHLDPQNPPLDQWSQAVDLLEYAHPEPNYASWSTVRWAVSDVATQLFRWYFTLEQLPATLELLDETAVEIHRGRD